MTDKLFENNQVTMMGEIVSAFQFSHEVFGEGFYMVELAVSRLSNYSDYIPLMVSERLIDTEQDYTGQFIRISGQFRSYNRHEEKKNRLVLSVFVRELEFLDEIDENEKTSQITYHASAGAEMHGLPPGSQWDATFRSLAGCRAGNMSNGSVRKKWSTGWHTKYL